MIQSIIPTARILNRKLFWQQCVCVWSGTKKMKCYYYVLLQHKGNEIYPKTWKWKLKRAEIVCIKYSFHYVSWQEWYVCWWWLAVSLPLHQTFPRCNANAACAALKPPLIKILAPITARLQRFSVNCWGWEWREMMCVCVCVCVSMTSVIYGLPGRRPSQQITAI